jgi:hypothetical protein
MAVGAPAQRAPMTMASQIMRTSVLAQALGASTVRRISFSPLVVRGGQPS